MRWLVALVIVVSCGSICRAEDPVPLDPKQASPVTVPGTRQFSLFSKEGNREYRIFVGEPKSEAPPAGFPVVYVLDGNATFGTLYDASRRSGRTQGARVVVGIGYPTDETIDSERRSFDFIPKTSDDYLARLPRRGEMKSGGQAEFIKFIEEDLKPVIEKSYKINRHQQAIMGHSFGGLFVLHLLFNKPDSFQSYVAISPSVWWGDMAILEEERAFTKANGARADLLIAVGGREQGHMIDDAREMAHRLGALSGYGLRVSYRELPEEDHGSVVPGAISAGLRFSQEAGPR